jgi:aminoglycoside phosphotransferase (APT) family kinase protein
MPFMMSHAQLIDYLREHRLLPGKQTRLTPLEGGVSSDIMLVAEGDIKFVLKRSLEKLRVEDDWYCNTTRNITECEAIRYASQLFRENVPKILHSDAERRLFVMEYLDSEYTPWKSQLLKGIIDLRIGEKIGMLLAELHASSWLAAEVRQRFNTGADFFALRVEPYLLTTGKRHPDLKQLFEDEADRLQRTALALVHGDWSAKNFLVSNQRVIILDWEVAWFGDPAFDAAFFLNLIYLKSLINRNQLDEYFDLMEVFRATYGRRVYPLDDRLEQRIVRLTLMLLLARIDGKSRVEYITSEVHKDLVRAFTRQALLDDVDDWNEFHHRWREVSMKA